MRTIVFRVPERDLEILVMVGEDGYATLAMRPEYGSWGPPLAPTSDSETPPHTATVACSCVCHHGDYDVGPRKCWHCDTERELIDDLVADVLRKGVL